MGLSIGISNSIQSTVLDGSGGLPDVGIRNVDVIKGYAKYPMHYGPSPQIQAYRIVSNSVTFSFFQPIQIYQDTEINEIKYNFMIGSSTDQWYVGLYKFDLPNNKLLKSAQWNFLNVTSAGDYSATLSGGPITISSGTYLMGAKSKDITVYGHAVNNTSGVANRIQTPIWSGDTLPNQVSGHLGMYTTARFAVPDPSSSVLPDEFDFSSPSLVLYFNLGIYMPYLIY